MVNRKSNKNTAEQSASKTSQGDDIAGVYTEIRFALMRFALRFLRKPQDVEDVVQEACVKALEAQNQRRIDHPKAYLPSCHQPAKTKTNSPAYQYRRCNIRERYPLQNS